MPDMLAGNDAMEEEFSDRCMHELMGSEENGYKKCAPSAACLEKMFEQGNTEYTITHQLLYSVVAEQVEETNLWEI